MIAERVLRGTSRSHQWQWGSVSDTQTHWGDTEGLWGCRTEQSQEQCWWMTMSAMPFKAKVTQITASEMPNFGMNVVKPVSTSKEISNHFFIRKRLVSRMGICQKEVQKEAKG